MSLQKVKDSIQRAYEINQSSAALLLAYKRQLAEVTGKIDRNPRLTEVGRSEEKAEAKKKHAVLFLQEAHRRTQEYHANVSRAIREAEKIIYTPLKKPDAAKLERFESELKAFRTELMFAPSQRAASDMLSLFIGRIDEPYLARRLREDFEDITTKIMSANASQHFQPKAVLAEAFRKLQDDFESQEVREARSLLDSAKAYEQSKSINGSGFIVEDAAAEMFGAEYSRYINDTASFFAANPELTPEPFKDEEGAIAGKTAEGSAWVRSNIDNPTLNLRKEEAE